MTAASSESNDRLQHSTGGLIRLSQMEAAALHLYVEGKNGDEFYYSKVLTPRLNELGVEVEFHLSREIPGTGEGKQRSLTYFRELRSRNALVSTLDGKRTVIGFLLDKDIDDVTGEIEISNHLIYTVHHCVENHIVRESDIVSALAAALGIDSRRVSASIPDQTRWLNDCCATWQEWTALCIYAHVSGSGIRNYKRPSIVNDPPDSPASSHSVDAFLRQMATRLAIDEPTARRQYEVHAATVAADLSASRCDRLFKGKWYGVFFAELGKRLISIGGVDERAIWSALCGLVDPSSLGSARLKAEINRLATFCF